MLLQDIKVFNANNYTLIPTPENYAIFEGLYFSNLSTINVIDYRIKKDENDFDLSFSGTCDNYEQILKAYPNIIDSDKLYIIVLHKIFKIDQPQFGGWRWKKFEPYIGNHNIECEYLHQEDLSDINQDYVVLYRVIEVESNWKNIPKSETIKSTLKTIQYELPYLLSPPSYKSIKNQFAAKYKKHDMWFNNLKFVERIQYVNLIEEGIDKFIKHDKTEESREYIVLKIYLKPE